MSEESNASNITVDIAERCVVDEEITNVETMEIVESMCTFSGDDDVSLESWLSKFEEMSDLHDWTDAQRIMYAKRLLRGSAKSFIEYETYTSWENMKEMLTMQFEETVDVYGMHKELLEQINDKVMPKKKKKKDRIIVPKNMQAQVVRIIHKRGHFSAKETEKMVRKDYKFRKIRKTVEQVVMGCLDCRLAERKGDNREELLNYIEEEQLPFDTYYVDIFQPLTCTKKIYEYIFVVVEDFSKYTWLYAISANNIFFVIKHLRNQSMNFGNPKRIISKPGLPFSDIDFKDYCDRQGIEHISGGTEIPYPNDRIESLKRTLTPLLRIFCPQKPSLWQDYLNIAQRYLNAIPAKSTNISPFQLLFGSRLRMKYDMEIWQLIEERWTILQLEERIQVKEEAKRRHAEANALSKLSFTGQSRRGIYI
jgi:hypothetical protein